MSPPPPPPSAPADTTHVQQAAPVQKQLQAEPAPDQTPPQRIVPYVEDRRNVLIVRPEEDLAPNTMATLQYALKRGILSMGVGS